MPVLFWCYICAIWESMEKRLSTSLLNLTLSPDQTLLGPVFVPRAICLTTPWFHFIIAHIFSRNMLWQNAAVVPEVGFFPVNDIISYVNSSCWRICASDMINVLTTASEVCSRSRKPTVIYLYLPLSPAAHRQEALRCRGRRQDRQGPGFAPHDHRQLPEAWRRPAQEDVRGCGSASADPITIVQVPLVYSTTTVVRPRPERREEASCWGGGANAAQSAQRTELCAE